MTVSDVEAPGRADLHLLVARILDRADALVMPDDAEADLAVEVADPAHPRGVDLGGVDAVKRVEGDVFQGAAEAGAVLGHDRIDVIDRGASAGAGQVLDDDQRIAGNISHHVPCEQSCVVVVAATGRRADHQLHLAALVEFLHGVRRCRGGKRQAEQRERQGRDQISVHGAAPAAINCHRRSSAPCPLPASASDRPA